MLRRCVYVMTTVAAAVVVVVTGSGNAAAATPQVRSGIEIDIDDTVFTTAVCTLGAVITPSKAVTAGHCGEVGKSVYDRNGVRIGSITANLLSRQADLAVISLARGVHGRVDAVDYASRFDRGQPVSKNGATSGFTTGYVTDPAFRKRVARGFVLRPPFLEAHTTVTVDSRLRSVSGDSGAGIRSGGRIVGILSSGTDRDDTAFAPLSLLPPRLR
ncbi:hypothetical protein GCM10009619_15520 [Williamsia maris]|uniref:Peptidase S1 domain-containing protein n=2 Tax=Williamsia maris TaxID=72806 RepID=A0ABT1HFN3_9NOCA|nr:hypothetical protein [Williamsia maris]